MSMRPVHGRQFRPIGDPESVGNGGVPPPSAGGLEIAGLALSGGHRRTAIGQGELLTSADDGEFIVWDAPQGLLLGVEAAGVLAVI